MENIGTTVDPKVAANAIELAEIMLNHEPEAVRRSLCRESVVALAQYLVRVRPDYCRAVTA